MLNQAIMLPIFLALMLTASLTSANAKTSRATDNEAKSAIEATSSMTLKCLFVYSNDIDDFGYVFAYEQSRISAERILISPPHSYSLKTNFWIAKNTSTAADEILPFIADGYTLFLFNGGQFTPAVNKLAASFPNLKFLGTSSIPIHPNTAMVMSRNYEWYFLNGIVCGMVTKSNKIAYLTVLGIHADPYLNTNAFWRGATMVNPNVQVNLVSSPSYVDDVIGVFAIDQLADRGIDCLAINQNTQTANARASEKHIISCGTSSDSRFSSGEYVFTSGIRDWEQTIFTFIKNVLDDAWIPAQTISEGFNQSALTLAWWSTLATEPQFELMRQTVQFWRDHMVQTQNETIFCGELATLTGFPKSSDTDCMNRTELLSNRRIVPAVIRFADYTRGSVTKLVHVKANDIAAIVVACLVAFSCLILIGTLAHIQIFSHRSAYKASSPLFMMFILFGMILIVISCIFWSLKPTLATCAARPWIAGIGWILIVSSLLAKTHRIYKIFSLRTLKVEPLPDKTQILKFMVGMLTAELVILIFWQSLSPLVPSAKSVPGLAYNELYDYCRSKSVIPMSIFLSFNAAALIPVVFVAWITRTVVERYNESSAVGLTSAVAAFFIIIIVGTTKIVQDSILAQYILPTIGMIAIVAIMYGMLFIPKILYVHGLWEETAQTAKVDSNGSRPKNAGTASAVGSVALRSIKMTNVDSGSGRKHSHKSSSMSEKR